LFISSQSIFEIKGDIDLLVQSQHNSTQSSSCSGQGGSEKYKVKNLEELKRISKENGMDDSHIEKYEKFVAQLRKDDSSQIFSDEQ
jgi:hypothetical protein